MRSKDEQVEAIFKEIEGSFQGMVPNFFKEQARDPCWLELNWNRLKRIMIEKRALDRKTKELIAYAVSVTNNCEYCINAHSAAALMAGATEEELTEALEVIELYNSFNAIADGLRPEIDLTPEMIKEMKEGS